MAHIKQVHGGGFKLNLDVIKTSLLLTLYDCTRYPSLKGWTMAGGTIRLAYEFHLDMLDPPIDEGQDPDQGDRMLSEISASEKEDRRHVFWSIGKLDVFYSGLLSRLFGVDS